MGMRFAYPSSFITPNRATRSVPRNQSGSHAAKTPEPCQVLTEAALRETFRATWGYLPWFLVRGRVFVLSCIGFVLHRRVR
jgi:hypothetical protein